MCAQLPTPLSHPVQSGLTISRNTSYFPKQSWEFPEWKRKRFSHVAFVISLIIIPQTVKHPFKGQGRPRDFNVRENKMFTNMGTDSISQLFLKKLPIVDFWHSIKAENILCSLKKLLKYPSLYLLQTHMRLDCLYILQPNNEFATD